MSKKITEKNQVILSCIISYLLLCVVSLFRINILKQLPNTAIINSALATFLGSIIFIILLMLSQLKLFRNITIKIFNKTLNDDIWRDVFDLKNGSNLKVYLKNKDYYLIGHLKNYEEKEENSWIALSTFAKFNVETNENYKNEPNYLDKSDIYITVRFSDIEHIEIF